jgi:hypothetical protein
MGYDHRTVEMCVVIQKMVTPKAAGVAFTLDPTNGDRSQVAIDAAWGFGEAVVAGEVTPDIRPATSVRSENSAVGSRMAPFFWVPPWFEFGELKNRPRRGFT